MPITIESLEEKIRKTERFSVKIRHPDGRDVRDDFQIRRRYGYFRRLKDSKSVSDWKIERFNKKFPEYECDVLDGTGEKCRGNMLLKNVRETYL